MLEEMQIKPEAWLEIMSEQNMGQGGGGEQPQLTARQLEHLRALGYLD